MEEIPASVAESKLDLTKWPSIAPVALSSEGMIAYALPLPWPSSHLLCPFILALAPIVDALVTAKFPLFIVAHSGRNTRAVAPLTELAEKVGAAVFMMAASSVCIPCSHPNYQGNAFTGHISLLEEADVILVLDNDLPWIDTFKNAPKEGARVFVIDPDPLKSTYGWSHIDAEVIARADSETALVQLVEAVNASSEKIDTASVETRNKELAQRHDEFVARMTAAESSLQDPTIAEPAFILGVLRDAVN